MPQERPRPGKTRPGGRTAATRRAVLDATSEILVESGFSHLDLAAVAERAGVGRTTVYRRWGSAAGLAEDLLEDMAETSLGRTRLGDVDRDLEECALLVRKTLADPRQGRLFRSLIAASVCSEETAEALHRFYAKRVGEWTPCVHEAVERGELPGEVSPERLVRTVSAPLYYQFLTTPVELTEEDAVEAAQQALALARAGLLNRPWTDEGPGV
ncbi:TetR/AcrR family transcriptional regulator [Salininema proteolyticum]|uniref:TetR/AcrR family transcriptional regulator n=1 Tax=Salininema proteolyticum TaxID=1607685 RepID=A0ABV8TTA2_9ACTN